VRTICWSVLKLPCVFESLTIDAILQKLCRLLDQANDRLLNYEGPSARTFLRSDDLSPKLGQSGTIDTKFPFGCASFLNHHRRAPKKDMTSLSTPGIGIGHSRWSKERFKQCVHHVSSQHPSQALSTRCALVGPYCIGSPLLSQASYPASPRRSYIIVWYRPWSCGLGPPAAAGWSLSPSPGSNPQRPPPLFSPLLRGIPPS
jgi:hypothetical protein